MAKFRLKTNTWTKEEQKVLGVPSKSYVILKGSASNPGIYRTFKTKSEALKKLKELNQ